MWGIVRSDHTRRLRLSRLGRCVIVYAVAHPVAPPSGRDRSRAHYSSEPADDHSSTRCSRRRSFELSVAGHHPAGRCRRFPRISRSQTGQHFDRNRIAQAMAQGRPQAAVDSQGHRRRLLDGQRRRWPRLHDGGDEGGRRERARDRSGRRQHRLVNQDQHLLQRQRRQRPPRHSDDRRKATLRPGAQRRRGLPRSRERQDPLAEERAQDIQRWPAWVGDLRKRADRRPEDDLHSRRPGSHHGRTRQAHR